MPARLIAPCCDVQENQVALGMDLHVQVLTSGFWPRRVRGSVHLGLPHCRVTSCRITSLAYSFTRSYPVAQCSLPSEFLQAQQARCVGVARCSTRQAEWGRCATRACPLPQAFRDFYLGKHSGRQLLWHHSLGSCILRARFDAASKELSTSLLQVRIPASPSARRWRVLDGRLTPPGPCTHACRRWCSCCSTMRSSSACRTSSKALGLRLASSSACCCRWRLAEIGARAARGGGGCAQLRPPLCWPRRLLIKEPKGKDIGDHGEAGGAVPPVPPRFTGGGSPVRASERAPACDRRPVHVQLWVHVAPAPHPCERHPVQVCVGGGGSRRLQLGGKRGGNVERPRARCPRVHRAGSQWRRTSAPTRRCCRTGSIRYRCLPRWGAVRVGWRTRAPRSL